MSAIAKDLHLARNDDAYSIGDVLWTSLIDYPNKISTVLFLRGCPLRCPYCHNMQFHEKIGSFCDHDVIFRRISRDKDIKPAVVISGGEPLLQDITSLVDKIANCGIEYIGLHTSGCDFDNFKVISDKISWVGLDFKCDHDTFVEKFGSNAQFMGFIDTFMHIVDRKIPFELRTTVDFDIISENVLVNMAKFLKDFELQVMKWVLQPKIENLTLPEYNNLLEKYVRIAQKYVKFAEMR